MIRRLVIAFLVFGASFAHAQEGDRRQRRDPMRRADRMVERLAEQLELDETQRSEVDTILESYRAEIQAWTPLRAEMRAAREEGDTARIEELRAKMEDSGGPRELFRHVIEDIEPILTDE